jgi:regulatory protein YycI of two-component signal transduction system YycFG
MKVKPGMWMVLIIAVFILVPLNIFLFVQYENYKVENRRLVLENDSVKAINIELKEALDKIKIKTVSYR